MEWKINKNQINIHTKVRLNSNTFNFFITPRNGKGSGEWQTLMYWWTYIQSFKRTIWQLTFSIEILQNIHTLLLKNSTSNNYLKELIITINKALGIKMSTALVF